MSTQPKKRVLRIMSGAAVVTAAVLLPASSASATAPSDGCPRGYEARTIADWASLGYPNAPVFIDSPDNGGNADGVVCGLELGEGTTKQSPSGRVLYEFRDNNVPPSS